MLSGSFGAQLILYSHLKKPDFYTGIAMGGPYFRHRDEDVHQKLMPYINFVTHFVNRDYRMNFGYDTKQKPHIEHWDKDPQHLGMCMAVHTIQEFVRSLKKINGENLF